MLAISRRPKEWFRVKCPTGEDCWIGLAEIGRNKVRLILQSPKNVEILRAELVPASERPAFVEVK